VVFVPLLAGGALLYAVFPRLRYRLRWPVGLVALAAAGSVVAAHLAGDAFRRRLIAKGRTSPTILAQLVQHKQFGDATMWFTLGLALATLVFVIAVAGRPPGFEAPPPGGLVLQIVFTAVLVILAGASIYYVVRTGDSGARIVWTGF
jgi:peptidoglycan/LPS O-acetylase OafA/YrhL